jgi:hypothetical protein
MGLGSAIYPYCQLKSWATVKSRERRSNLCDHLGKTKGFNDLKIIFGYWHKFQVWVEKALGQGERNMWLGGPGQTYAPVDPHPSWDMWSGGSCSHKKKTLLYEGQFLLLSQDVYWLTLSFLDSQHDHGDGGRRDSEGKKMVKASERDNWG